ncbi:SHOCT domain-containing protein [Kitasatospora sp. NPDC049258]|uniref:SHOCT domain-containing protein n=1 Tax=Kitasatospora sp. NPDC049258 TaxID=3155394 RepID=UPI00342448EA
MLGRSVRRAGRPGVLGMAARTAVVAGTATAVSGRVSRRQDERATAQQEAQAPPPAAPPPATPPAPAGGLTDEDISSLERLGKLHQQGVLSDQELAAAKARILGG